MNTNSGYQKWKPRFTKLPRLICRGEHTHFSLSAKWRRQNTMYVDDRSNWICLCDSCSEENDAHWRDMWADYYAGCL